MDNSLIVLISGKQGSGKTTAAQYVRNYFDELDFKTYRMRFAEPLYRMHDKIYEVMQEYGFEKPTIKDGPLLQLLGTEWGRNTIDKDIWAKACFNKVSKVVGENIIVTIEDCRFENELDIFPNALKIRLVASPNVRRKRCLAWRENETHPSEMGLDEYLQNGHFNLIVDTDVSSKQETQQRIIEACRYRMAIDNGRE